MLQTSRIRSCLLLLAASLTGVFTYARSEMTSDLTVYASPDPEWVAAVAKQFEAETGIKVAWIRESTGVILQRLKAEKNSPKADVWFGGTLDGHAEAANTGLLEAFTPTELPNLGSRFQNPLKNQMTTGVYAGILGFSVNAPLLQKLGKPIPTSWNDLLNPTYKGLIAMANPNTSGTALTALASLVKLKGEDAAFQYLKQLHPNIAQYTQSGAAPAMMAGKGEIAIGVIFLQDSIKQRLQGMPLSDVIPAEGTGFEIGGLSLIKGAPQREQAQRFINWLQAPKNQPLAAASGSFQVPSNTKTPLNPNIIPLEKAALVDLDVQWMSAQRAHLLDRWTKEVFGQQTATAAAPAK